MSPIKVKQFSLFRVIIKISFALKWTYKSHPIFYLSVSVSTFLVFWFFFNVADQLLFVSPFFYFYIPSDAIIGFAITNASAALLAFVIALNIYAIRNSNIKLNKSLLSGSVLGIASAACASCSSIGFLLISTFGSAGIIVTGFLTNYQIPLRILSMMVMIWALIVIANRITTYCRINSP